MIRGERGRVLGEARDGVHVVRLVEYLFPDCPPVPYLEVEEAHPEGYRGRRVLALSTSVHALLNLGEMEIYQVGERARDWEGQET